MVNPNPLPEPLLEVLSGHGSVRRYPARMLLVGENDGGDALYVVLSGRIKAFATTSDGREVVYGTQGSGEMFGEVSLDGGPRSASVMTLEPTSCLVIPGPLARRLLIEHPPLAQFVLTKLIGMVRQATANVKSLALGDVYQRIARLLESLEGVEAGGYRVVGERLTQREIAERIGCSREMVSRVFKQLTEGGYVRMRNGRIVLLRRLPSGW